MNLDDFKFELRQLHRPIRGSKTLRIVCAECTKSTGPYVSEIFHPCATILLLGELEAKPARLHIETPEFDYVEKREPGGRPSWVKGVIEKARRKG